jgi:hypothetical protein
MLREALAERDSPADLKDGPYERYLLVVWAGEMHLTKEAIGVYLVGICFPCTLNSDAFISLDCRPGSKGPYPAIPLTLERWRWPAERLQTSEANLGHR